MKQLQFQTETTNIKFKEAYTGCKYKLAVIVYFDKVFMISVNLCFAN